jgi:hypothetical protein
MNWRSCLLLLGLWSCSSSQRATIGGTKPVAEIVPTKLLRIFHDASSLSLDQFLNVYVVESSINSVIKLSPVGDSLREVGGFGSDHYQFNGPIDIDARLTNAVFIADNFNHRIEQYTKDLTYVSTLTTHERTDASQRFGYPRAVAADDAGNIYIADGENKRVIKARSDYSIERTIGGYTEATRPEAVLTNPVDLGVDRDEHLLVLDNGGTSLAAFDNLGNILARVPLNETAKSIATSNDTIFVLIPSRSIIRVFRGPDLVEHGSLEILRTDMMETSPIEGVAFRSGAVYLLTQKALYRCAMGDFVGEPTIRY